MNEENEKEFDFGNALSNILFMANGKKSRQPQTPETRRWAVFYTEIEKCFAYYDAFLKGKEVQSSEIKE